MITAATLEVLLGMVADGKLDAQVTNATAGIIETDLTIENFDAVWFPGGSGHGEADGISPAGVSAVRAFVQSGGGSLHILNAKVKEPWDRGDGMVSIKFTDQGRQVLQVPDMTGDVPIFYGQGPILVPYNEDGLPPFTALAHYTKEIHSKHTNETKGQMLGAPAISVAPFGKGRVLVSSPHPELTHPTITELIIHYLAYVTNKI
eukprot:gene9683-1742_t